jgi:hypothetical protein
MKRFITGTISMLILIGLSGCGTKQCQYVHEQKFQTGIETLHSPKFNTIVTREVGSNLYEKINQISHNTYDVFLNEPIAKMHSQASGTFAKEKGYIGMLSTDKATNWKCACTTTTSSYNPYEVCLFDSNNDGKFDKIAGKINTLYADLDKPVSYTLKRTKATNNENSFKYTALYQGKIANKIKISFREFTNNMARPAFTQNIEYELKNDGTAMVGFKGLRIKVLKATNIDITYKVIKDYN